jgi:hypothetical protein
LPRPHIGRINGKLDLLYFFLQLEAILNSFLDLGKVDGGQNQKPLKLRANYYEKPTSIYLMTPQGYSKRKE